MTGSLAIGAIAAAAAWLCLALALPAVAARWRAHCFWVAVAVAVPLLGWLTWAWGPGPGTGGFLLGLLALQRSRCGMTFAAPPTAADEPPSQPSSRPLRLAPERPPA